MKNKTYSIWSTSPCSLGYPFRAATLQKSQRFGLQSIYYHEQNKPRQKLKLQIIRPQSCLIQFRRKIQECQKYRKKGHSKSKSQALFKKNQFNNTLQNKKQDDPKDNLIQRLTFNQKIEIDKIFDRNGIRSTFFTSLNGQQSIRYSFKKSKTTYNPPSSLFKGPKVYVSGTTRIDLSKPQNFNPGPGSYFLDKRDNQQISQLYRKAHKSTTKKLSFNQNQNQIDDYNPSQKQNVDFFQEPLGKLKNKNKKSKLQKVSLTIKSRKNFRNFPKNI